MNDLESTIKLIGDVMRELHEIEPSAALLLSGEILELATDAKYAAHRKVEIRRLFTELHTQTMEDLK